jgi:hypothetical protein
MKNLNWVTIAFAAWLGSVAFLAVLQIVQQIR